jgi:hypothetical protein
MTEESFLIMLSIALIATAWMVLAITYEWAYRQPYTCPPSPVGNIILL